MTLIEPAEDSLERVEIADIDGEFMHVDQSGLFDDGINEGQRQKGAMAPSMK